MPHYYNFTYHRPSVDLSFSMFLESTISWFIYLFWWTFWLIYQAAYNLSCLLLSVLTFTWTFLLVISCLFVMTNFASANLQIVWILLPLWVHHLMVALPFHCFMCHFLIHGRVNAMSLASSIEWVHESSDFLSFLMSYVANLLPGILSSWQYMNLQIQPSLLHAKKNHSISASNLLLSCGILSMTTNYHLFCCIWCLLSPDIVCLWFCIATP